MLIHSMSATSWSQTIWRSKKEESAWFRQNYHFLFKLRRAIGNLVRTLLLLLLIKNMLCMPVVSCLPVPYNQSLCYCTEDIGTRGFICPKMDLWHLLTSADFGFCRWVPRTKGYNNHTPESQWWFWICRLAPLQDTSVVHNFVVIICSCLSQHSCICLNTELVHIWSASWGHVLGFPECAV